jgi:hypothetical protein
MRSIFLGTPALGVAIHAHPAPGADDVFLLYGRTFGRDVASRPQAIHQTSARAN